MAEKTNVPEIRFAGFTDPWEQRKLGELGSVAMCKRIFKEQTTEQGDVPFYKIGTFGGTPDAFISRELFDEYQRLYQFPKVGDILISAAGTIGRTIVYQGDPAYYQDSNIVWLQHDERLDNGFLLQFLNGKSWSSLEGSTLKRLYNKDLLNAEIATPSPDEQHQIGSTFAKLDDIITLHQRKYDKLAQLKKSMLDKMFPKPGERFPEIRFAGFTDPWEQRKLGDVATIVGGGTPSTNNDAYWDGDIDWYSPAELGEQVYADRSVRRITQAGYDSCSATLLPAGKTILFTSRAGIGNTAILRRSACTNQGFQSFVVNDDADVYFVYSMTDRIKKFAEQKASGSTFLEISGKGLAAGEFASPSKDEQTAIGSMFKQLDHLITLHQRKLELLRNTKKSLLDRMFV